MAITAGEYKRALTKRIQGKRLTARQKWVLAKLETRREQRSKEIVENAQREEDARNGRRRSERLRAKRERLQRQS